MIEELLKSQPSILPALIGGLVGGFVGGSFAVIAQYVSHKLTLSRERTNEIDVIKNKLQVFIYELQANKEMTVTKRSAMESLISGGKWHVKSEGKFFYNPHSHTEAFKEFKSILVFGYDNELVIEIQNIYDELQRLDRKVDIVDDLIQSPNWRSNESNYSEYLFRGAIEHYKLIETRIADVVKKLKSIK